MYKFLHLGFVSRNLFPLPYRYCSRTSHLVLPKALQLQKKMMLLIIFRFWLLLSSNHTERGRCRTLGSRDIYGLIPPCRTNYRLSLKYYQCLVTRSRWCHRLPRGGIGWKIDTDRITHKWAGSWVRESLKVCSKSH